MWQIFCRGQKTQNSVKIPGELPETGQLAGPKVQEDQTSPWRTVRGRLNQDGHAMVPVIRVEKEDWALYSS